jgi:outer membrane receptor protein involved in Fe transport
MTWPVVSTRSAQGVTAVGAAVAALLIGTARGQEVAATAPDASLGQLEEITVTATRQSEPLSKVPISVAAYSSQAMDQLGVRSVADLASLTPGVTFSQVNPGSGTNIQIRGISSLVGAATTGIYIDDTPIQIRSLGYFPSNVYPQVFDLDRVEILRGPQGTLFGAGSEGGTVRFITPEPSLSAYSEYARGEVANVDGGGWSYEGGAAVGGPIVPDRVGFRLSAWYRRDAGWIDRVDHDTGQVVDANSNQQKSTALRFAMTFQPTAGLQITPGVYYQRQEFNNTNLYWTNLSNPGDNIYRNGDPLGQPGSDTFTLSTLKLGYTAGPVSVFADSAYFRRRSIIHLDYSTVVPDVVGGPTAPPFGIPGYTSKTDEYDGQDNFTQEIRLQPTDAQGRVNWLVGLFYSHSIQTSFEGIGGGGLDTLTQALFGVPVAAAIFGPNYQPGDYALISANHALDRQYAIYGNLDFSFTEQLKITAGVRVAHVSSDFSNVQGGPFGGGVPQTTGSSTSANPATPKVALDYQMDSRNLFYASVAKGYRVGGGDAPVPIPQCSADLNTIGLTGTPETYRSDSLWSYEVGAKNRLFDDRLRLDSSVYFIDWKNIQQQVFLPNCNFKWVANLGELHSRGFDLEAQLRPIQQLTAGAAVGYNKSDYLGNVYPGVVPGTGPNSVIVSKGDTLDSPPWSVTLLSRLTLPVRESGTRVYFDAHYIFRTRNNGTLAFSDPASLSYDPRLPRMSAQRVLDLRAGVTLGDWDISLFSNNVTNSTATTFSLHDSLTSPLFKNVGITPRVYGLTVVFRN